MYTNNTHVLKAFEASASKKIILLWKMLPSLMSVILISKCYLCNIIIVLSCVLHVLFLLFAYFHCSKGY